MSRNKTVQLSTRVSDEDATFLAELEIEGATTPSDKMRALIAAARRRHEGFGDYKASLRLAADLIAPTAHTVREAEEHYDRRSDLVAGVLDWLPEMVAFVVSHAPGGDKDAGEEMLELEEGIANRVFRLQESVLRLGVTVEAPCYETDAVAKRLRPTLEMAKVLETVHRADTTKKQTSQKKGRK